jgi:L-lactate dehydrogenase complex protein LldG
MEGNGGPVNMELTSRDKILDRIKRGLHGPSGDLASGSESLDQKLGRSAGGKGKNIAHDNYLQQGNQNLIDLFRSEAGKVNGVSRVVSDDDKLREYIAGVAMEHDSKSFLVWETPVIKQLKVAEYLKGNGLSVVKSHDKMKLERADIGITETDYAIADSGTLVLFSEPEKSRLVSLITPIHIAILDSKKIIPNIFDLFRILRHKSSDELQSEAMTSCITFITGPSRTADIELNLTLGVHGPKEVHILIYN